MQKNNNNNLRLFVIINIVEGKYAFPFNSSINIKLH